MLVITVAYPFDESEIRQTVIKLVGDALNQGERMIIFANHLALRSWWHACRLCYVVWNVS